MRLWMLKKYKNEVGPPPSPRHSRDQVTAWSVNLTERSESSEKRRKIKKKRAIQEAPGPVGCATAHICRGSEGRGLVSLANLDKTAHIYICEGRFRPFSCDFRGLARYRVSRE